MNKLLVWLSVLLVVVFGGRAVVQYMSSSAHERAATTRVEAFLGATLVAPSEGADEASVVVACTIDGRRAGIAAIRNQPLEWAD